MTTTPLTTLTNAEQMLVRLLGALKDAREDRGMTHADVAHLTDLPVADITALEAFENDPSLETLIRVAAVLDVDVFAVRKNDTELDPDDEPAELI